MAAAAKVIKPSFWERSDKAGRGRPVTPPPQRPKDANKLIRAREYLTADEVERMISAARRTGGRMARRDELLILLGYRHGLRATELTDLRWDQIDLKAGDLHVSRRKHGRDGRHPLRKRELSALHAWKRVQGASVQVFTALGGKPMTRRNVYRVVANAGKAAGLEFPVHPHMLRHACGFYLANSGQDTRAIQDYLGHKNIQHTVGYTRLAGNRFNDFWKD